MKKGNILAVILLIATMLIGYLGFRQLKIPNQNIAQQTTPNQTTTSTVLYTSQDLKISFNYPRDWSVEEEDRFTLISNFDSSLHKNIDLKKDQIEITIDEFSGCFPTLEEDLINPACGQGKNKNKIISKEVKQTPDGEFLKYTLDSYDENQQTQYFFRKGEIILEIDKSPDPSQYEKEFEEIINSIQSL